MSDVNGNNYDTFMWILKFNECGNSKSDKFPAFAIVTFDSELLHVSTNHAKLKF